MTTESKAWLYCTNVHCVSHWTGADSAPRSQPKGVTALVHQGSWLNRGGAEAGEKEGLCHGRGELHVPGQASQGRAVWCCHWGRLPRRSDTELLPETRVSIQFPRSPEVPPLPLGFLKGPSPQKRETGCFPVKKMGNTKQKSKQNEESKSPLASELSALLPDLNGQEHHSLFPNLEGTGGPRGPTRRPSVTFFA